MNEKLAFKKLNKLFIAVKRMNISMNKNEQGITRREKRHIIEQIREINQTIK